MEPLLGWPTEGVAVLTRADIVRWWEARRLRFNLYVVAIGVVTWFLVLFAGSAAVKPGVDFEEPLGMIFGPFVYVFMANIWLYARLGCSCRASALDDLHF